MPKFPLLAGLLFYAFIAHGQDFTNKGREFWLGFGNHQQMFTGSLPDMDIYITADQDTWVTIDIPAMSITIGTYSIRANQITHISEITQEAFSHR